MKRPEQVDIILWQRNMLYISGFYPSRKGVYFYLSCFITQTWSWLILLALVMRMILDLPDTLKVLTTLQFSMTQFAFLAKGTPFLLRMGQILKMEEDLKNPLFSTRAVEHDRFIQEATDHTRLFSKFYCGSVSIAVTFLFINPLIDNTLMTIPAWFPFDTATHRYEIIMFQGIGFIFNAWSNCTIDLYMSGLISLMSAQLEILKDKLNNITGSEKSNGEDEVDDEEVIYQRLVNCVQHHEAILDFVERIEAVFSLGVFFQFFASIMTVCLTGIVLTTIELKPAKFVTFILYFVCMILQIAINCWFGHDIMVKSDDLIYACYMNNWYETSPRVRRMLFMIMEKAKRPVTLTAGKLFILNLSTFVSILRSSYSYFAVLNRLYGD